jgi:phosphoserine phosphatase RsbU/P
MSTAPIPAREVIRPQLLERRSRLMAASTAVPADYLHDLIAEIDAALGRVEDGSFGVCETCHDPIEPDRLEANPFTRFCVDHLTQAELQAHQQDLDLATQIQSNLLPPTGIVLENWDTQYRYVPALAVGGDYCELMKLTDGKSIFFAVGDVAGKGVAASLLMTHLSAILRSLLSLELPLAEMIGRANRLFCESTAPAHYATLVCGRATADGVELLNAGHCTPVLLRRDTVQQFDSTGLPLGLFFGGEYAVRRFTLDPGDYLVLYSDGITEAQDPAGDQFEVDHLIPSLRNHYGHTAKGLADAVLHDVTQFRKTQPPADDMTLLVIRRT